MWASQKTGERKNKMYRQKDKWKGDLWYSTRSPLSQKRSQHRARSPSIPLCRAHIILGMSRYREYLFQGGPGSPQSCFIQNLCWSCPVHGMGYWKAVVLNSGGAHIKILRDVLCLHSCGHVGTSHAHSQLSWSSNLVCIIWCGTEGGINSKGTQGNVGVAELLSTLIKVGLLHHTCLSKLAKLYIMKSEFYLKNLNLYIKLK